MSKNLLSVIGQSNERGPGPSSIATRTAYGPPCVDPIGPSGGFNSWWPRVVDLSAKRGNFLNIYNAAVDSTSIGNYWAGCARNWFSGIVVNVGSYVIYDGNLWKCIDPNTTSADNLDGSTVAPSEVVGADNVEWQDLGPVTSGDVDGVVYRAGSSRFDPNGVLSSLTDNTQSAPGYDNRIAIISLGQADATINTSLEMFRDGLISVADYLVKRGYKVGIGMTIYTAVSGFDAVYQSNLIPGRAAALSHFASNPAVFAGANLREALGVLPVSPTSGIGLQADELHGNQDCMFAAAEYWDAALEEAGY